MNEIAGAFIDWYTLIYLILHVRCKVDVYMPGPWVYQEVDSGPWCVENSCGSGNGNGVHPSDVVLLEGLV